MSFLFILLGGVIKRNLEAILVNQINFFNWKFRASGRGSKICQERNKMGVIWIKTDSCCCSCFCCCVWNGKNSRNSWRILCIEGSWCRQRLYHYCTNISMSFLMKTLWVGFLLSNIGTTVKLLLKRKSRIFILTTPFSASVSYASKMFGF